MRCIEGVILFLWAILAPIFWIPFLVRMITLFIAAVLVSAGNGLSLSVAQRGLESAARFYPDGFVKIRQSLLKISTKNVDQNATWKPVEEFWKPLFVHVVSIIIFWGITMLSIYYAIFA